jgi:hypothetical protein
VGNGKKFFEKVSRVWEMAKKFLTVEKHIGIRKNIQ